MEVMVKEVMTGAQAIKKVAHGREFHFKLHGAKCRCVYEEGQELFTLPKALKAEFRKLINEMDRFERRIAALELDWLDVSNFLYKYFQLKARMQRALCHIPILVSEPEPYDVQNLPLEEQALWEVLGEQTENAIKDAGSVDGTVVNVTHDMVDARIEEMKKAK